MDISHASNQVIDAWHKDQVGGVDIWYSKYRVHYPHPIVFDNSTQF